MQTLTLAALLFAQLASAQEPKPIVGPQDLAAAKAEVLLASNEAGARLKNPSTDPVTAARLSYSGREYVRFPDRAAGTPQENAAFKLEYWTRAQALIKAEADRLDGEMDRLSPRGWSQEWEKIAEARRLTYVFLRTVEGIVKDAKADLDFLSLSAEEQKAAGEAVLKRKRTFTMRLERAGPYLRDEIGPCGRPR